MHLIGRATREYASTNQKHHPDLVSDTSPVWNLCCRFSDFISKGNKLWHREMLAVFSCKLEIAPCENNEEVYSFQWSHHEILFADTTVLIWGCKRPLTNYFYLAKADMLKTCTFVVTFHASNYDLSLPVPGSEIVGYPKLRKRKRENKTRADIFVRLKLAPHLYVLRARSLPKGERVDVWPSILKIIKLLTFLKGLVVLDDIWVS